jgi:hypothetical protein
MPTESTPPISTQSTPASAPVPGTSSLQQQQLPPPTNNSGGGSWKLPIGIEDHIEDGVIKITAGVVIGGTLGMLLFKSGKGWRSASIASGLGVALGSSYVRFISSTTSNRSSTGTNNGSGSISTSSNTTVSSNAITPVARLQPFDTKPVPTIGKDASQSS